MFFGMYILRKFGYNQAMGMKFSHGKPKPPFVLMTSVIFKVAEIISFFCGYLEELRVC